MILHEDSNGLQQEASTVELGIVVDGMLYQTFPDLAWHDFLAALLQLCDSQGWELEYGDVDDGSCAIFATTTATPRAEE